MTRPGLITATHPSGEPLPEPIRVSAGLAVTDLSGKMLIQTLPPRLILRVIAIRAASIWRLVTQPCSIALRPYSPNWTRVPPLAMPRRRPRCGLRNLVRLGSSTTTRLLRGRHRRRELRARTRQPREQQLRGQQLGREQPSQEPRPRERRSQERRS